MDANLTISNAGPLIIETNYWSTHQAAEGYYYVSLNSGAFRLLVPNGCDSLADMRAAKHVVITHGVIKKLWMNNLKKGDEMLEIMFEDDSDSPFVLYVSVNQLDRLPSSNDVDQWFEFTAWENRRGKPHKVMSKRCFYRRGELQNMKPV